MLTLRTPAQVSMRLQSSLFLHTTISHISQRTLGGMQHRSPRLKYSAMYIRPRDWNLPWRLTILLPTLIILLHGWTQQSTSKVKSRRQYLSLMGRGKKCGYQRPETKSLLMLPRHLEIVLHQLCDAPWYIVVLRPIHMRCHTVRWDE